MQSGKNIRLFQNSVLEKFTYVHPIIPLVFWGPVISYCFATGLRSHKIELGTSLFLFGIGLFIWTFSEYALHRHVFHFKARGQLQARISFLIHGIHHEDPDDQRRLLMPPLAGVVIAAPFYILFSAVLGATWSNPLFAGFLLGYLGYDYTHFAVHYLKPKSKLLMELKKNHLRHHYKEPNHRFGVSTTFWDHVFGTHP